jgi:hypothetical protein
VDFPAFPALALQPPYHTPYLLAKPITEMPLYRIPYLGFSAAIWATRVFFAFVYNIKRLLCVLTGASSFGTIIMVSTGGG